jgi:hypothetical protein
MRGVLAVLMGQLRAWLPGSKVGLVTRVSRPSVDWQWFLLVGRCQFLFGRDCQIGQSASL